MTDNLYNTPKEFRSAVAYWRERREEYRNSPPIQPHELPRSASLSGWMFNEHDASRAPTTATSCLASIVWNLFSC